MSLDQGQSHAAELTELIQQIATQPIIDVSGEDDRVRQEKHRCEAEETEIVEQSVPFRHVAQQVSAPLVVMVVL